MMPVGEERLAGVGRQVGPQPALLGRACRAAAGDLAAVAVQHDDVPGAQVVAVVARARRAGRRAEVGEVGSGLPGVLVVAERRARAGRVPAPGGRVAAGEGRGIGHRVGVVAEREDRAGEAVEQAGGGLVAVVVAGGDVTGADEDGRPRGGRHGRGRRRSHRSSVVHPPLRPSERDCRRPDGAHPRRFRPCPPSRRPPVSSLRDWEIERGLAMAWGGDEANLWPACRLGDGCRRAQLHGARPRRERRVRGLIADGEQREDVLGASPVARPA